MAKFRKKPIVIEAFQFVVDVAGSPLKWGPVLRAPGEGQPFYIETLEGSLTVTPNDWIITGVKGEVYPCKDDIFRMTYEPVEDSPDAA